MISLWKLLDSRTPEAVCMKAYRLYLSGLEADGVVRKLREEGFTERTAARAATFIASAFARVHYSQSSYVFAEYFYPGMKAYRRGRFLRYADEPIFQAAVKLCTQLVRDGDAEQVMRFVEMSAEHRGIAEALERGLMPTKSALVIHEF